jgi:hypothetical protein
MTSLRNTPTIPAPNCCFHCQTSLEIQPSYNDGASTSSNDQLNAVFEVSDFWMNYGHFLTV